MSFLSKMGLPNLYQKVYIKWEYIHDTCPAGYHVQDVGDYYIEACLVKGKDNVIKWKLLDDIDVVHKYDQKYVLEFFRDWNLYSEYYDIESVEWVKYFPSYTSDLDEDEILQRKIDIARSKVPLTIKEQNKQKEESKSFIKEIRNWGGI